jgi:UDP-glucose 4-epimerase
VHILVTGGAGYVGSVVVEELLKQGNSIIVYDNLSQGNRKAVAREALFIKADLCDKQRLEDLFSTERIDAVMHLAAHSQVTQSMKEPAIYFENNVSNGLNLLNAMISHNVKKLIFSSSCAIFGQAQKIPIEETHPEIPASPYGESKLIFERLLYWYSKAYNLSSISLRYFNAAGASENCGEDHDPETHLIPNILKVAMGTGKSIQLYGTDYPTKDGTCIRDYIHIVDIARAHILGLDNLNSDGICKAYNLGNGKGYSVLEVIEMVKTVSDSDIQVNMYPRRPGDPPVLIAGSARAKAELGWEPAYPELKQIISTAWEWQKRYPRGYGKSSERAP